MSLIQSSNEALHSAEAVHRPFLRLAPIAWLTSWLKVRTSDSDNVDYERLVRRFTLLGCIGSVFTVLESVFVYHDSNFGPGSYAFYALIVFVACLLARVLLDHHNIERPGWVIMGGLGFVAVSMTADQVGDPVNTWTMAVMLVILGNALLLPKVSILRTTLIFMVPELALLFIYVLTSAVPTQNMYEQIFNVLLFVIAETVALSTIKAQFLSWQKRHQSALERAEAERHTAQQALVREEAASRAKTEFLATMTHDLRTPLNSIIALTQMMQQGVGVTAPNEGQGDYLKRIEAGGNSLLHQFTQIMTAARLDMRKGELSLWPLSAAEIEKMSDSAKSIAEGKGLRFDTSVTLSTPPSTEPLNTVMTDPERLNVIINNLLTNAIKFTEHGSVRFSVQAQPEGWSLEVADSGLGIPPEHIPHLFEKFYQVAADHRGIGLGLNIVQAHVDALHGAITVLSTVGKGTTFRIVFPNRPPVGAG